MGKGRYYSFEIISYWIDVEGWKDILDSFVETSNYLFIVHDKDRFKDVDGVIKPKTPHIHTYLSVRRELSFLKLSRDLSFLAPLVDGVPVFTVLPENIRQIDGSLSDCFDYALHTKFRDDIEHFNYNRSELHYTNLRFFTKSRQSNNKGADIVIDLLNGVSLYDMMIKYGRDFIIHYNQYMEFVYQLRNNSNSKLIEIETENCDESPF